MDKNWRQMAALVVALTVAGLWLLWDEAAPPAPRPPAPAEGYLFCSWNVENLFDDQDDPRNHDEDEDWFGQNPDAVREKVRLLAQALLLQNDGRGPDILAAVEVESLRAAELLRDALNDRLPTEQHYDGLAFRPNATGRRFAPALLTRLAVQEDRSHNFGIRRILEARIEAQGVPLTVLASHWTSRLRGDTEEKREAYADALFDRVTELARDDPACDVLIAGDFNDGPDDPSLTEHLHTTGDPEEVRRDLAERRLTHLLDLPARLDPEAGGTYFHNGRWEVLDHIVAAPGLLDPGGWSVLPETIHTENGPELRFGRDRRPWRFGGPKNSNPRGPSDHFALTVRLRAGP